MLKKIHSTDSILIDYWCVTSTLAVPYPFLHSVAQNDNPHNQLPQTRRYFRAAVIKTLYHHSKVQGTGNPGATPPCYYNNKQTQRKFFRLLIPIIREETTTLAAMTCKWWERNECLSNLGSLITVFNVLEQNKRKTNVSMLTCPQ